jgi:uncharacterized protein (TIGR02996 family)
MNPTAGLLLDIIENPEDDTPRLVYADWLEENDELDRATFIRLQLTRAKLPANDRRIQKCLRQETALLTKHAPQWLPSTEGCSFEFHRGFIEFVSLTPQQFVEFAPELFAKFPIRRVCVRFDSDDVASMRKMSEMRLLTRVMSLRCRADVFASDPRGDRSINALLGSPQLQNVEELDLTSCRVTDAILFNLQQMGKMRDLVLNCNTLSSDTLGEYINSPAARNLVRLALDRVRVGPSFGAQLRTAPLTKLQSLDLSRTNLQAGGIRGLTESRHLTALRELWLCWLKLGPNSAGRIARCATFANLRLLSLNNNNFGDDGVSELADSPHLKNLLTLQLRSNQLRTAGAQAVGRSKSWTSLKSIDLGGNWLDGDDRDTLRQEFGKRWGKF